MNFIKNIILHIKNIFKKQEEIKQLEAPKSNKKQSFLQSLNVVQIKRNENKEIETLICEGDGLGIKKKISY